MLSDGRTLLLAVAPAASPGVKSAAAAAIAAGAAAALHSDLQSTDVATMVHTEEEMLPCQAFYAMSYMVRISTMVMVCRLMHETCMHGLRWSPGRSVDLCVQCLQQAALEAVCSATPAAQLLAHKALLPAWRAAASTLQLCSEVVQCMVAV
jgi:hypothetical protein